MSLYVELQEQVSAWKRDTRPVYRAGNPEHKRAIVLPDREFDALVAEMVAMKRVTKGAVKRLGVVLVRDMEVYGESTATHARLHRFSEPQFEAHGATTYRGPDQQRPNLEVGTGRRTGKNPLPPRRHMPQQHRPRAPNSHFT